MLREEKGISYIGLCQIVRPKVYIGLGFLVFSNLIEGPSIIDM